MSEELSGPVPAPPEFSAAPAIAGELAALRVQVTRDHDRAAARERIIERLHDENQRLRAGERQLLLRPLLTDLQRLRHDMLRTASSLPASLNAGQAAQLLRSYADNLELTLDRGGITVVAPAPGTAYDPATQRVLGTVPATDRAQDATVASVLLDGYHDVLAGRTVAPAAVHVHQWTSATGAGQEPDGADGSPDDAHPPIAQLCD